MPLLQRYLLPMVVLTAAVMVALLPSDAWLAAAAALPTRQFDGSNYVWFEASTGATTTTNGDDDANSDRANNRTNSSTKPSLSHRRTTTNRRQSISNTASGFRNTFQADFHLEYADGFVALDPNPFVLKVVCSPKALQITVRTAEHVGEWQRTNATLFNGGMGWNCTNAEGRADAFFRRRMSVITVTPAQWSGYNVFVANFATENASPMDCLVGNSFIDFSSEHIFVSPTQPTHGHQTPSAATTPPNRRQANPQNVADGAEQKLC